FSPQPATGRKPLTSSERLYINISEPGAPRSFALWIRKALSSDTEDPMLLLLRPPSFWSPMPLGSCHSCGSVPLLLSLQGSQHMLCSCTTQLEARGVQQAESISAHIRRQREVCGELQ
ncbi:mCG142526, partial [Mus musculus]